MLNSQVQALLERTAELEKIVKGQSDRIANLEHDNLALHKENKELKARLQIYENAHTPPSRKMGRTRPLKPSSGRIGAPKGHKGATRPEPEPDRVVDAEPVKHCPVCNEKLGEPDYFEGMIQEDIPEPQPVMVTQFNIPHYTCHKCGTHVAASHPDCSKEGRFGYNTQSQVALLKYDGRLPNRKVAEALERDFGLKVTPATVLDINRRVSDKLQPQYRALIARARASPHIYIDETGLKVAGKRYWIWVFVTDTDIFVVIRPSRGKKVLVEVLGKKYTGTIICDGLKSYSNFTRKLQRCWAHLLREAKFVAGRVTEATALNNALHKLYRRLESTYRKLLSVKQRQQLWRNAKNVLRCWVNKPFKDERLKKFVEKIRNGFEHWFTFILNPNIEPTNNRAERGLREHVVIRKIIGCLRGEKGTRIHETIMSLLATWKMQKLNLQDQLITALKS